MHLDSLRVPCPACQIIIIVPIDAVQRGAEMVLQLDGEVLRNHAVQCVGARDVEDYSGAPRSQALSSASSTK